jgi:hypothetical protein
MDNGIIKGTGNSRFLKSIEGFLDLYPTYEAFAKALVDGTLPIDLNGINADGWQQLGTRLDKSTLLTDETAALCGLDSTATLDDALKFIRGHTIELAFKYSGTGTTGEDNPTIWEFAVMPKCILVIPKNYYTAMYFPFRATEEYQYVSFAFFNQTYGLMDNYNVKMKVVGNKFYMYGDSSNAAMFQANESSRTYNIFAIY